MRTKKFPHSRAQIHFRRARSAYASVLHARTQGGGGGGGGSRGFGRTPFLAGYTYYLCDTLTLDESLVRRTGARDPRLLAYNNYSYAHSKASGVARFRGSHFTRERGWVWN